MQLFCIFKGFCIAQQNLNERPLPICKDLLDQFSLGICLLELLLETLQVLIFELVADAVIGADVVVEAFEEKYPI